MKEDVTGLFTTAGVVAIVVLLVAVIEFFIDRFTKNRKENKKRSFFLSLLLSFLLSWFIIDQLYTFPNIITHTTLVVIKTFEIFALTYGGQSLLALISKKSR